MPREITKISIPSIDEFRLNNILSTVLKDESKQVTESLLQVVSNYQEDLRTEVKRKISIEQKIQYKNISIAKLTYNLHKLLEQKNKKLSKLYVANSSSGEDGEHQVDVSNINNLDKEVGETLDYAVKTTRKVHSLAQRLLELDKKLSSPNALKIQRYPKLFRMLELQDLIQTPTHSCPPSPPPEIPVGKIAQDYEPFSDNHISHLTELSSSDLNKNDDIFREQPSNGTDSSADTLQAEDTEIDSVKNVELISISQKSNKCDIIDEETTKTHENEEPLSVDLHGEMLNSENEVEGQQNGEDSMDQVKFEEFMSHSIQKYRQLQEDKYGDSDLFENFGLPPSPLKESSDLSSTGSNNRFNAKNPLNLLYSNLILRSLMSQPSTEETATSLIFLPTMNVKLAATVKQSLRNSHFKKLRINGNPITSATFQNMKDKPKCACDEHTESHHADLQGKSNLPDIEQLDISTELEDEDLTYSSSALNSDDNESDLIFSSSDDDSEDNSESNGNSSEDFLSRMTNDYYMSLQRKLKRRRRSQKRTIPEITKCRDESPTPKHKPSHRTLKPKRSILKNTVASGPKKIGFAECPKNGESSPVAQVAVGASATSKLTSVDEHNEECSPRADLDIHWSSFDEAGNVGSKLLNFGVCPVMVLGTILAAPEVDNDEPEESLKEIGNDSASAQTISNLRVRLQQDAH